MNSDDVQSLKDKLDDVHHYLSSKGDWKDVMARRHMMEQEAAAQAKKEKTIQLSVYSRNPKIPETIKVLQDLCNNENQPVVKVSACITKRKEHELETLSVKLEVKTKA